MKMGESLRIPLAKGSGAVNHFENIVHPAERGGTGWNDQFAFSPVIGQPLLKPLRSLGGASLCPFGAMWSWGRKMGESQ